MKPVRPAIVISLIVFNVFRVSARLPDWQSNQTIWHAAMVADPDDPSALTNASHAEHDALEPLYQLCLLEPPDWLPDQERQPYIDGLINLSNIAFAFDEGKASRAVAARAVHMAPTLFHGILRTDAPIMRFARAF